MSAVKEKNKIAFVHWITPDIHFGSPEFEVMRFDSGSVGVPFQREKNALTSLRVDPEALHIYMCFGPVNLTRIVCHSEVITVIVPRSMLDLVLIEPRYITNKDVREPSLKE